MARNSKPPKRLFHVLLAVPTDEIISVFCNAKFSAGKNQAGFFIDYRPQNRIIFREETLSIKNCPVE